MKNNYLKKILALMVALSMLLSFTACDSSTGSSGSDNAGDEESYDEGPSEDVVVVTDETELEAEGMKYVLIYNPEIYDENKRSDKTSHNTGYFGSQIVVDGDRADGLDEEEYPFTPVSQADLMKGKEDLEVNLEGNRADPMGIDYSEGDVKEFYCSSRYDINVNELKEFECIYEGEYCYVWVQDTYRSDDIAEYGKIFDENVYEQLVNEFGEPRFVGDSGKVNLLCYPISGNTGGYFWLYELYSSSELSNRDANRYGINRDHAIIHLNSELMTSYETYMKGTLAHEFQHLLVGTAAFCTADEILCDTWMNESMSGYVEEQLFPGGKEEAQHFESFNSSDLIRNGQSLYNFTTTGYDIGVYGSVYYFSEYLAGESGADVFSNFHEYWRDSYSDTLCVSEALANSVSSSFYKKVNNTIDYDGYVDFDSEDDEWMSKMTLNFYLHMLQEQDDFEAYDSIKVKKLLYDELDGTDIEGGGRIIVAVSDEYFEIPEDSDDGLVYVGLDEDFNVVTPFVYK